MSAQRSKRAAVSLLVLSMACPLAAPAQDESVQSAAADIMPPTIVHTPLERFPAGMPLRIQARVTDQTGVREVVLFYRNAGESQYRRMPMVRISNSSLYAATLPSDAGSRVEYYIQAADVAGNSVLGNLFDPYVVAIEPASRDAIASSASPVTGGAAATSAPPASAPQSAMAPVGTAERRGISRWVWVGIGVVAVAALATAGGGGGSGGGGGAGNVPDPTPGTGSVTINAPVP